MSQRAWTIRPYRSGDEAVIVELFAQAFDKRITTTHWLWKLRGYELPFENVWLAFDGEKLIFHYAGIPVQIQTGKGNRWAVLSVDTMGHPDYRRQGLMTDVARRAYDYWRQAGVAFVYGLPNEQSGPALGELGLRYTFPLQWRKFPIRPLSVLARRYRIDFPTTLLDTLWIAFGPNSVRHGARTNLVEATDADSRFDHIDRRLAPRNSLRFIRNREWVHWRYFRPSHLEYQLLVASDVRGPSGYVAYRQHNTSGIIAEVLAGDDETASALVRGAIERLRTVGAQSIAALAVPGTPSDRLFKGLRFLATRSFGLAILPLASDISREYLSKPDGWDLSGADFDVV